MEEGLAAEAFVEEDLVEEVVLAEDIVEADIVEELHLVGPELEGP